MKILCFFKGIVLKIAVTLAFVALNGATMAYDFDSAWKEVEEAQRKDLPRTVTNKVAEIEREAVAGNEGSGVNYFTVRPRVKEDDVNRKMVY